MAVRKRVYLLRSYDDGAYVATAIVEGGTLKSITEEWRAVLERTHARRVLNPEQFPDQVIFHSKAIDELRERNPKWDVTYSYFVRVASRKNGLRVAERNIDD